MVASTEKAGIDTGMAALPFKPNIIGLRHVQCGLMFGGLVFGYFLRVNMSAAIVSMVEPSPNGDIPHYDWDTPTRSLILSSFFWGYVVAQVPAGILAKMFGAKIVLGSSTAICSIVTVLLPLAAECGGWKLVCGLRVVIGLGQGTVYPCVHTFLSKWAPRPERGVLATCVYSGAQLGTVIVLATSGILANSQMGWPSIFYFSGGITFVWAIVYIIFGADAPSESKAIGALERDYIEKQTGGCANNKDMPTPWAAMFTSIPFYALLFAHCGFTWGFYTLLTEIPSYLSSALDMDMKKNALLSALPYLVMWLMSLIVSPISDALINRGVLSVTNGRKLFNTIGQWVPMACLIALGFMTKEETTLAITFLTLGVGFNAASAVGYMVNHMDLAPNFAGTMMGVTNGISNLLSVFAPLVVGAVVTNESDPSQWRIVFLITAGIYLVCNSIFLIFGKATVQEWNEPEIKTSKETLTTNVSDLTQSIKF